MGFQGSDPYIMWPVPNGNPLSIHSIPSFNDDDYGDDNNNDGGGGEIFSLVQEF